MPSPRKAYYPPFTGTPHLPPGQLTSGGDHLGLLPHPGNAVPAPPPRAPLTPLPDGWIRSFHAVPAAYPRHVRESHGSNSRTSHPFRSTDPPANESKDARRKRMTREVEVLVRTRYDAEEWSLDEARAAELPGQFLAVERWRRAIPRGGQTLICTHANGTIKEHWHPVLLDLLARDPTGPGYMFGTPLLLEQANVVIDDIWLFDELGHGASADLNAGLLGSTQLWRDLARDMVNFVIHVLPTAKAERATLPWQLRWAEEGAVAPTPVIGFGASFGGAALLMAAAARPNGFEGVFLVDPMVAPRLLPREKYEAEGLGVLSRAHDALKRRDTWVSRDAAREAMGAQGFFQRWDPAAFDLYISHGLVPVNYADPEGPVTLATAPWAEAMVFCEPFDSSRGWDVLPDVRVPLGFLMARDSERTLGDRVTQELVWRAPFARNERATDADHLIIQESPRTTADAAWRFLQTLSAGQWGTTTDEIRASYAARSEDRARL